MKDDYNQRKNPRGSSPHPGPKEEVDHSVKGVRSIEQPPGDPQTPRTVELRENHTGKSRAQESSSRQKAEDERRWEDDGGENE